MQLNAIQSSSASLAQALVSHTTFPLTRERLEEIARVLEDAAFAGETEIFAPSFERNSRVPEPSPPSGSATFDAVLNGLATELRDVRIEVRTRANRAFSAALVFGITGGIMILATIGLLLTGTKTAGTLSSICSAITTLFSGLFAKVYFTENRDLRSILGDLSLIERVRLRLHIAEQMKDTKRRDDALFAIFSDLKGTARQVHALPSTPKSTAK